MGTWSLGGVTHYGSVDAVDDSGYLDGASVAVHVRGNTAYTAASGNRQFYWAAEFGILFILSIVIGLWRGRTRRVCRLTWRGLRKA
jgi:hypothetical protein